MQNDMRDRLVELLQTINNMRLMRKGFGECADYLIANGVIVLPCKVGDTVYLADEYYHCEAEIEQIVIDENGISFEYVQYDRGVDTVEVWDDGQFGIEDIGTKVYLTLEDKEKAETDLLNMEVE